MKVKFGEELGRDLRIVRVAVFLVGNPNEDVIFSSLALCTHTGDIGELFFLGGDLTVYLKFLPSSI